MVLDVISWYCSLAKWFHVFQEVPKEHGSKLYTVDTTWIQLGRYPIRRQVHSSRFSRLDHMLFVGLAILMAMSRNTITNITCRTYEVYDSLCHLFSRDSQFLPRDRAVTARGCCCALLLQQISPFDLVNLVSFVFPSWDFFVWPHIELEVLFLAAHCKSFWYLAALFCTGSPCKHRWRLHQDRNGFAHAVYRRIDGCLVDQPTRLCWGQRIWPNMSANPSPVAFSARFFPPGKNWETPTFGSTGFQFLRLKWREMVETLPMKRWAPTCSSQFLGSVSV